MCGIAGFIDTSGQFTEENLLASTNALAHRGPDACGSYFKNGIGLGHRRLSIIDLSQNANQPMFSHDKRYIMVYNGEIYNFRELASKYFKNQHFDTTSDSEVILELFALKGVDFVNELNGMFAIAIYDTYAKELYIFRDRMGIKPLVYFKNHNQFAFASEIKALLKLGVSREIDFTSLQDYLF